MCTTFSIRFADHKRNLIENGSIRSCSLQFRFSQRSKKKDACAFIPAISISNWIEKSINCQSSVNNYNINVNLIQNKKKTRKIKKKIKICCFFLVFGAQFYITAKTFKAICSLNATTKNKIKIAFCVYVGWLARAPRKNLFSLTFFP